MRSIFLFLALFPVVLQAQLTRPGVPGSIIFEDGRSVSFTEFVSQVGYNREATSTSFTGEYANAVRSLSPDKIRSVRRTAFEVAQNSGCRNDKSGFHRVMEWEITSITGGIARGRQQPGPMILDFGVAVRMKDDLTGEMQSVVFWWFTCRDGQSRPNIREIQFYPNEASTRGDFHKGTPDVSPGRKPY